jgi:hypothetical protein
MGVASLKILVSSAEAAVKECWYSVSDKNAEICQRNLSNVSIWMISPTYSIVSIRVLAKPIGVSFLELIASNDVLNWISG